MVGMMLVLGAAATAGREGRRHREAASPGISRTDQTNRYTRFHGLARSVGGNFRAAACVS